VNHSFSCDSPHPVSPDTTTTRLLRIVWTMCSLRAERDRQRERERETERERGRVRERERETERETEREGGQIGGGKEGRNNIGGNRDEVGIGRCEECEDDVEIMGGSEIVGYEEKENT
jgi:hypothetical protein